MRFKTVIAALCLIAGTAQADEGYWLYSALPRARIAQQYKVSISSTFARELMQASARLEGGGSGFFASRDGLFITNQHIAVNVLADRVTARDGFVADTLADEKHLPGAKVLNLQSIEDVTAQVLRRKSGSPLLAQDEIRIRLDKVRHLCEAESGIVCQVAELSAGAQYELHKYKKYTDIRLVFCSEDVVAHLHPASSSPDQDVLDAFTFDVCALRAYEDGKPARIAQHLQWSASVVAPGEPVLASGFPFSSERWTPYAQLTYERDVLLPQIVAARRAVLDELIRHRDEDPVGIDGAVRGEQYFMDFFSRRLSLLRDPYWMEQRRKEEAELRGRLRRSVGKNSLSAFSRLDDALRDQKRSGPCYALTSYLTDARSPLWNSLLFSFYVDPFLAAADALSLPAKQRGPQYQRPSWESLAAAYGSPETEKINKPVEEAALAAWLKLAVRDDACKNGAFISDLLHGEPPEVAARRIIGSTAVGDPAFHRLLLKGDDAAVVNALKTTEDPSIVFARKVQHARAEDVEAAKAITQVQSATADITRARVHDSSDRYYPDATRTLRLSYGAVSGYELNGRHIPPVSTFDAFSRWLNKSPSEEASLPARWTAGVSRLDSHLPFMLSTTLDTASGSSGSPIVNRRSEWVGIVVAQAPTGVAESAYEPRRSRTIGLSAAALSQVLRRVYGAEALAAELERGRRSETVD